MFVSRLKIENVRGFLEGEAATDISVPAAPGWYVFAGRNGSGKSTLLRSLALALAGPDVARQLLTSAARWIRKDADTAQVSVDFSHNAGFDRFIGMGKLPAKKGMTSSLIWKRQQGGPEPELSFVPQRQTKLAGAWRGPWSGNPTGWLVVGYGPFRRLTGHNAEAVCAMMGPHHVKRLASLFYEDPSLKEVVEWLKTEKLRDYQGNADAKELLSGIASLLNDGLLPDDAQVEGVDPEGLWVTRAGTRIELQDLSDGYRVALGLVLDLIRHMSDAHGTVEFGKADGHRVVLNPGVVLIDEVDAHLHISWQQRIGDWLKGRFPEVQFFVTTHSPFVCQAASAHGLFTLPGPGDERGIELVDESTYVHVVNGGVEDAVLSRLFGLERSESAKAHELRLEWSRLQAKMLRKALSPTELRRHKELARQLPFDFETSAAE